MSVSFMPGLPGIYGLTDAALSPSQPITHTPHPDALAEATTIDYLNDNGNVCVEELPIVVTPFSSQWIRNVPNHRSNVTIGEIHAYYPGYQIQLALAHTTMNGRQNEYYVNNALKRIVILMSRDPGHLWVVRETLKIRDRLFKDKHTSSLVPSMAERMRFDAWLVNNA